MTNLKLAATNEVKIDKGIPMPSFHGAPGRSKYPFASMEVGDSFAVSADEADRMRTASYNARRTKINEGKDFTVRKQPDGSFRCWRIA